MATNKPLLNDLLSTYKQYKADTESIAGWLAETSAKCGYKLSAPQSTRLKGKARKEAKKEAMSAPANAAKRPSPSPKYTIRVSDFVAMSQTIAGCEKPKVKIPEALHNLFERAIDAREKFNDWCERMSHGDRDSNHRHMHFVGVLKAAWNTLRPSAETEKTDTSNPLSLHLSNRFAGLRVEDLSHIPEVEEKRSTSDDDSYRLSETRPAVIVRDEDDIEDDFYFAVILFCIEIMHVRKYLQRVWADYREDKMELIQASLVTNTAILLVRQAENDLDAIVERPKKYPVSTYPVWTFPAIVLWHEHDLICRDIHMDDYVKVSVSLFTMQCGHSELFFWDTFNALKASACHAKEGGPNSIVPDLSADYTDISDTQRRIFQMLPLLQVSTLVVSPKIGNEEISRGIRTIFDSHTVPIWAAFGMQVLLDIQDELACEPEKALKELQDHAKDQIQMFRALRPEGFEFIHGRPLVVQLTQVLDDIEEKALKDQYGRLVKRIFNGDVSSLIGSKPDAFLRQNPIRCGMLKYDLYLQLHRQAMALEKSSTWLTAMMHVYVACQTVFPEDPVWPDMEYLLRLQDKNRLFFGGVPQSIEEADKKLMLAHGAKASSFARNSRSTKGAEFNFKNIRCVSNRSVLDDCFKDWMDGIDPADIENWVTNLVRRIHDFEALASVTKPFEVPEEPLAIWRAELATVNRSIPEICSTLAIWIQHEALHVHFGWFQMLGTCEFLWRRIAAFMGEENNIHCFTPANLLTEILGEAREVEALAEETKQDRVSFLRSHAALLTGTWDIIKAKFTTEMTHRNPSTDTVNYCAGDVGLLRFIIFYGRQNPYVNANFGLFLHTMYKNWPASFAIRSAVRLSVRRIDMASKAMPDDSSKSK